MDKNKFFTFLDKYRKWIMLVGFILIVGFLCTGFRFVPYLSSANWKGVLMLLGGELNEDFQAAPLKYKINAVIGVINFFLMLSFFILSAISIISTFCKKNFYYSIPFGILILLMYLSYRGQTIPALYYRIPLTIAFVICLTLELLSKYRDRLIKKAQPSEPSEDNFKSFD